MEIVLTVAGAILVIGTYRRFRLSNISYTLIFVYMSLHTIGAHYTYALVPYDDWARGIFGISINDLFGGELGTAYLGTQGDEWDAHKDMGLATPGAMLSMGTIAFINWRYSKRFGEEGRESLTIKELRPLGEVTLREMLEEPRGGPPAEGEEGRRDRGVHPRSLQSQRAQPDLQELRQPLPPGARPRARRLAAASRPLPLGAWCRGPGWKASGTSGGCPCTKDKTLSAPGLSRR